MVQLLAAMLLILATWALVAPSLVGIGLLVRGAAGARSLDAADLATSFWVGAAGATLLLQLWHLALPVDGRASAALCALGALGLCLYAKALLAELRAASRRPVALAVLVAGCIWIANRAAGPCDHPDSGLYQLQAVRWASEFPIVPGLANLNNNLGFNNSGALLAATMDIGFWYGRAAHLFNPLLLGALMFQAVVGISRALRARSGEELGLHLLGAAFLTPAVDLAISPHASSFTTDLGTSGMLFVAGSLALRGLIRPQTDAIEARADLFTIAILSAGAVTWKLSAAGPSLCLFLLAAVSWWRGAHPGRALALGVASAASGLQIVPWMIRGVVLSGYPLFPSPLLPFDVDWRVPLEHAAATHAWVVQFARVPTIRPDELRGGLGWVPQWLASLPAAGPAKSLFPLVFLAGIAGLGAFVKPAPTAEPFPRAARLFFVALLFSTAFWFFTAPAPRFGAHTFWLGAGATLLWFVRSRFPAPSRGVKLAITGALVFWVVPTVGIRLLVVARAQGAAAAWRVLVVGPGPDHGLHPTPTQAREIRTTDAGDRVWVPIDSDMCWDGPLPITPFFSPNLAWRAKGDLGMGFRAGPGPWRPEVWPHYGSNYLSLWRKQIGEEPAGPATLTPAGATRLVAPRVPAPEGGRETRAWRDGV